MQDIVVEAPYEFIPPHRGRWWPWLLVHFVAGGYLRKHYSIRGCEVRGAEKLRASLDAGHGIVLTSNHPRPCDPMAASWITRAVEHPFYCMASWHTFLNSKIEKYLMRRCGAFSIHRESTDHTSLNFCVNAVATADRPIIIYAEGFVTRHNDQLAPLLDGSALIARMAARRRAKLDPPGKVVLHGIAFKYFYRGDVGQSLPPILERLEEQLAIPRGDDIPLTERVERASEALLALRERERLGESRSGDMDERIDYLLSKILEPLEQEWVPDEPPLRSYYQRVQRLRTRILPELIAREITAEERQRRRDQLAECYLAQQLGCYPQNYHNGSTSPERLLETVERLEEDLTDEATIHGPLDLVIQVGDAIEIPPRRERTPEGDPIMLQLNEQMSDLIEQIGKNPPQELRGFHRG